MPAFAQRVEGGSADGRTVLRAEGIRKSYGGIRALTDAHIELRAGEVHGLIGENGSGKSTLLGILSGQNQGDGGRVWIEGREQASPKDLRDTVAIVTQELSLAQDLSVGENILLGHAKPRTWRGINWPALHAQATEALGRLGLTLHSRTPVHRLRIDQQQLVEIARAVELQNSILILDEPTSSLTEDEVVALARIMEGLRERGTAIVFVTHRMDELLSMTDRITVLRDGRTVDSRPTAEYDRESLTEQMLGYKIEPMPHASAAELDSREELLTARGVCVPGQVFDADLTVHAGEVVGLYGLEGSGRGQLLHAIFGANSTATGSVTVGGASELPRSPAEAIRRGLAFVPADRKNEGLMLGMTIAQNLAIAESCGGFRFRPISMKNERTRGHAMADSVGLQSGSQQRLVGSLSGGNQQKVLLGKWLLTEPQVLLLDEPTRGVDVGAKREIHSLIGEIRDAGKGIIFSSSDMDELLQLGDRFVILFRGRVVGQVLRADATEARLSNLATGGEL